MLSISLEDFDAILEKSSGTHLSVSEIETLLNCDGERQERLFSAARSSRDRVFGGKVFLYGFVYFSTYCKNNCTFCYYRRDNKSISRYRKTIEEIIEISVSLKKSGVHLVDLTMGEDPEFLDGEDSLSKLYFAAHAVKNETGLPVMISPGVIPDKAVSAMADIGVQWYACYQETYNKELFGRLRIHQSFEKRLGSKHAAVKSGMLVEEGILVGVGETTMDIANSLNEMGQIGASQVRVMTFVPQKGAPLKSKTGSDYRLELNTIAVMRLMYPGKFIPASLDVEGQKGLCHRLNAGANVVTSIIAPETGLAGVSNSSLDIENGARSVEGIRDCLKSCGLAIASQEEYNMALAALRGGEFDKADDSWGKASGC